MTTSLRGISVGTPPPPYGADPNAWPQQQQPPQSGPYTGPYTGPYAGPTQPGPYGVPPRQAAYGVPQGPGGYPQQQPWGAPAPAAAPQYGGPYPAPAGEPACRVCGARPAVPATVRGHQGMIVLMRFLRLSGPFCRDCGTATFRDMSAKTLWQGWWGVLSVAITPITLLMNLGPRARFRRLAAPAGGFRPPLDPGKPLPRRPEALLFLVPMVLFVAAIASLLVIGIVAGDDTAPGSGAASKFAVGECVRNKGDWQHQDLNVTDCGGPDAEYKVTRQLRAAGATCGKGEYISDLKYGDVVSCLKPLH
jgi:hypothetical protein